MNGAHFLDGIFYRPCLVIASCAALAALLSLTLLGLKFEADETNLWLSESSEVVANHGWLSSVHKVAGGRYHTLIFSVEGGGNLLQPTYLKQMYKVRKMIFEAELPNGEPSWKELCLRSPVINITEEIIAMAVEKGGTKNVANDLSLYLYPEPYCSILNGFKRICQESSILDLWANDGNFDDRSAAASAIASATKEDILNKINDESMSGLFLRNMDFVGSLGVVERDNITGRVTSAKAARFSFVGLPKPADNRSGNPVMDMEAALIKVVLDKSWHMDGFRVDGIFSRSTGDVATNAVYADLPMLIAGFAIVYAYVTVTMGKLDQVECRIYLVAAGILSVLVAVMGAYGLACVFGQSINPMHGLMPFLIVGLGVDDMFIIMQAFETFCHERANKATMEEKFGHTMRISGVAVTVTSLTDFVSFGLGATTSLPGLRSFCVACAIGVITVYLMQVTWFLAWFVIDQGRIEAGKSGILPYMKAKKTSFNPAVHQKARLTKFFKSYGEVLMLTPVRGIMFLLGISVYGILHLHEGSNSRDFLPKDSYLEQFYEIQDKYYPPPKVSTEPTSEGLRVFFSGMQLPKDLERIECMVKDLEQEKDIILGVDSWLRKLKDYYENNIKAANGTDFFDLETREFRSLVARFLFSPGGASYKDQFEFAGDLVCGRPAPHIKLFWVGFTQWSLSNFGSISTRAAIIDKITALVKRANLTQGPGNRRVFPMSGSYVMAATDSTLRMELFRNLGLAVIGMGVTTIILMSSFRAGIQVLVSVVITLVNVVGFMHLWGLKIETLSCVLLIICIGISVDYSAHIAHCFLRQKGCAKSRCVGALSEVGPAVFYGAFSTFLSVVLLGLGKSHVVELFFKVIFLVVAFAFYNSVVTLPVALSFLGGSAPTANEGGSKGKGWTEEGGVEFTEEEEANLLEESIR